MQVGQMKRFEGTSLVPSFATCDGILVWLVIGEILLLYFLRRYFGSRAHGG